MQTERKLSKWVVKKINAKEKIQEKKLFTHGLSTWPKYLKFY